jgi:GntR family transcriptional regulator
MNIADLNLTPIDPNNPLPLYYQVYQDLKRMITSERFCTGDQMPPELELCQAYGVGRQTVRQAIARLVDENLVERFAGRGTFILPRNNPTKFYLDRSFTKQMAEMNMHAHSKVLRQSLGVIDETAPGVFRKSLGSQYLWVMRLRFGDNQPIGVQTTIILLNHCPGIEKFDFNQASLYQILSTEYHLEIVEISHIVSAIAASNIYADLLQTAPGEPLLLVRSVAYLSNGEPVEATTSHYRADRYEFSTTHTLTECE